MQYTQAKSRSRQDDPNDDEKLGFPFMDLNKKPYRQYDQTFTCQHVHFYLSEEIKEPSNYTDMVYRISAANPADVIFIHLNTPGGQLDTGVQIINAMQNSQAKIITVLEGMAYSLGTLIFLAGDEMIVNDHCMMMFHNFNGGLIGKGNELTSQLDATVKWFASLAKNVYTPFLTVDEFERIVRGEDLWMQSPEIRVRLEKMVQLMQQEAEAEEIAEQEAAAPKKPQKAAAKSRGRQKGQTTES